MKMNCTKCGEFDDWVRTETEGYGECLACGNVQKTTHQHTPDVHNADRNFSLCSECGEIFGKIPQMCPLCKRVYTDYPALSRVDNKTDICSDCGTREAFANMKGVQGLIDLWKNNSDYPMDFSKLEMQQ